MVITSRVRTTFFVPTSNPSPALIRLPPSVVTQYETKCERSGKVIATSAKPPHRANIWSSEEHERFLHGLELFPNGPWKDVAAIVRTKTTRQTMTHAQKYRQKIERRLQKRQQETMSRRHILQDEVAVSVASPPPTVSVCPPISPLCTSTNAYIFHAPVVQPNLCLRTQEAWGDMVDSTHFDQEFEALLATLEPLPWLSSLKV